MHEDQRLSKPVRSSPGKEGLSRDFFYEETLHHEKFPKSSLITFFTLIFLACCAYAHAAWDFQADLFISKLCGYLLQQDTGYLRCFARCNPNLLPFACCLTAPQKTQCVRQSKVQKHRRHQPHFDSRLEQPIFQPTPLQRSQEESRNAGSRTALRGSLLTFWILLVSLLQFCSPQTQPKPGPPRLTKAHELMCARARLTPARTHFHFC